MKYLQLEPQTTVEIVTLKNVEDNFSLMLQKLRDTWYKTSFLLDQKQTANGLAKERFDNYKKQPLQYTFPKKFTGKLPNRTAKTNPKQPLLEKKESTLNEKWQMPCT